MGTRLARLAEDLQRASTHKVVDALEAVERHLASEPASPADLELLERAFARLVTHESSKVRQALARALANFPHESFERLVGALAVDDNAYVRSTAERVLVQRTNARRTDVLREQHDEILRSWLEDLERRHGVLAREAARKVAYKFAALIVREAHHEFIKVLNVLSLALGCLDDAHSKTPVDHKLCQRPLESAANATVLLGRIFESIRDLMTEITPRYSTERLADVLSDAVSLATKPAGPGVDFGVDAPADIVIEVDRHQLALGLSNLLKNAAESYAGTGRPPRVSIRARLEDDDHVTVKITDEGCGMSPEQLRSAFRMFKTTKPGGTGFGLPLALKAIDSLHGGRILLKSREGEGTVVTVRIPRVQNAGEQEQ